MKPPHGFITPTPTPTATPSKPIHKGPANVHHALAMSMLEKLMANPKAKHIVHHHFQHGVVKNA